MKIKNIAIGLCMGCIFFMTSCSEWLDVQPSNQTSADDLFTTEEGFKEALTGVYTLMTRPNLYGKEMTYGFVDVIAQQWALEGVSSTSYSSYYFAKEYEFEDESIYSLIESIWASAYTALANVNDILEYIDDRQEVLGEDSYELIKGEALGLRAYLHFDLLRLFAPNDFVLGTETAYMPYVTELTKNTTVSMTAQEVCEHCIADLLEALDLMVNDPLKTEEETTDTYFTNRTLHMNYYAVEALLARVYLYMGDNTNALEYAKDVIEVQTANRFRWVSEDEATASSEEDKDLVYSSEFVFGLNIEKLEDYTANSFGLTTGEALINRKYNTSQTTLFDEPNDYRERLYATWDGAEKQFIKFKQVGLGVALMPMIRISEMYYIVAECATGDEAIDALTAIRNARRLTTDISTSVLSEELYKEYQKEFTGEGQLFYYYKRLNIVPDNVSSTTYKSYLPLPTVEIDLGNRAEYE